LCQLPSVDAWAGDGPAGVALLAPGLAFLPCRAAAGAARHWNFPSNMPHSKAAIVLSPLRTTGSTQKRAASTEPRNRRMNAPSAERAAIMTQERAQNSHSRGMAHLGQMCRIGALARGRFACHHSFTKGLLGCARREPPPRVYPQGRRSWAKRRANQPAAPAASHWLAHISAVRRPYSKPYWREPAPFPAKAPWLPRTRWATPPTKPAITA